MGWRGSPRRADNISDPYDGMRRVVVAEGHLARLDEPSRSVGKCVGDDVSWRSRVAISGKIQRMICANRHVAGGTSARVLRGLADAVYCRSVATSCAGAG